MTKCIWLTALLIAGFILMIATVPVQAGDSTMGPGDTLKVTVLGEQDLTRQVMVDSGGKIVLPLVGEIQVSGKTSAETTSLIVEVLKKYIKNPQVTLEVAAMARRNVAISGAIKTPGLYPIGQNAKLVDLVSLAGGQSGNADLTKIGVTRAQTSEKLTINLQEFYAGRNPEGNVLLQDGDSILIPELGLVLVMGQVRNPGQLQLTNQMTVRQVIERAGGITDLADTTRVTVKRGDTGQIEVVNYAKAIMGDATADLTLNGKDEVSVPALVTLGKFTVTNGVRNPGVYPITGKVFVTDAISLAGGTSQNAKLNRVTILRGNESIKVDLAKVQAGKMQNVVVLPGDSISVDEGRINLDPLRTLGVASSLFWLIFGK